MNEKIGGPFIFRFERSFSVFTQLLLFFEIFFKNICLEYSED